MKTARREAGSWSKSSSQGHHEDLVYRCVGLTPSLNEGGGKMILAKRSSVKIQSDEFGGDEISLIEACFA